MPCYNKWKHCSNNCRGQKASFRDHSYHIDDNKNAKAMNFLSLIRRKELVGGIALSNTGVQLAFFKERTKTSPAEIVVDEEPFPEGAIVGGKICDKDAVSATLKTLFKRVPNATSFYVVSISPENVYAKVLAFPPTVTDDKLQGAVQLAIEWELPFKREDVYIDFEKLDNLSQNEILLAACKKIVIDDYLLVLAHAGVNVVAIEWSTASIARAITHTKLPFITAIPDTKEDTITLFNEERLPCFTRTLPKEYIQNKESIDEEIRKIRDYYESAQGVMPDFVAWDTLSLAPEYEEIIRSTEHDTHRFFASIGAAVRGRLPREDDRHISLLPLNTQAMYESEKAIVFTAFLRNTTIGIACFFILAYIGVWVLMSTLQANASKNVLTLSTSEGRALALLEEAKIKEFNEFVRVAGTISTQTPQWSPLIEELQSLTSDNITISSMLIGSPESPIHLTGVAKNRAQLNLFKKTLEQTGTFKDIVLPLANLDQKENIPFSISISLRDPETVMFHK